MTRRPMTDEEQVAAELAALFDHLDPAPDSTFDEARAVLWRTRICPAVYATPQTGADLPAAPARPSRLDPAAAGHQTPTQEDAQGWVSGHCGSTSVSGERPQLGSGALSSDPHGRGSADRAAAVSGSHPQTASSEAPPVAELLAPPLGRAAEAKAAALPNPLTTGEGGVSTPPVASPVGNVMTTDAEPVVPGPDADPQPWFRCRCASYMTGGWPDPYEHRCPARATSEDGLCDHCRQPFGGCADPECPDPDGSKAWGCCLQPAYAVPLFVDLTTPCRRAATETLELTI